MKKIFILTTISLIIISCSKNIQVYDTATTNTKLEKDYWVFENDSIKLTYEFWTERGIMSFSVYNKVDKPIYVDWKNSSFIHNSNKLNYWVDEEFSSLQSYYGGYYYKGPLLKPGYAVNEGVQNTASKTIKPERITFIPPKSYYYRSQFYLMPIDNYKVNRQIASVKTPDGKKPSENNSYYEEIFENQNSPVKFRNYLAFSFSENSQTFFFVDNEFYVSSIKEMKKKVFLGQGTKKPNEDKTTYVYPFRRSTSFYVTIIPEY